MKMEQEARVGCSSSGLFVSPLQPATVSCSTQDVTDHVYDEQLSSSTPTAHISENNHWQDCWGFTNCALNCSTTVVKSVLAEGPIRMLSKWQNTRYYE